MHLEDASLCRARIVVVPTQWLRPCGSRLSPKDKQYRLSQLASPFFGVCTRLLWRAPSCVGRSNTFMSLVAVGPCNGLSIWGEISRLICYRSLLLVRAGGPLLYWTGALRVAHVVKCDYIMSVTALDCGRSENGCLSAIRQVPSCSLYRL